MIKKILNVDLVISERNLNRIIEMAWEDRTPFDAIEATYGLNQNQVEDLMRDNLKRIAIRFGEKGPEEEKPNTWA